MNAFVIQSHGGPEVLVREDRPIPVPGPHEVLIRVHYSGINRPDIFQRKGNYAAPAGVVADIPGLEVSGRVEAVGTKVQRWKAGDWVCALLGGGGYAAYAVADEGQCLPLRVATAAEDSSGFPDPDLLAAAGGLPETLFTVWHNAFQRGGLRSGQYSGQRSGQPSGQNVGQPSSQRLLVHGGSGGIGTTAIRLGHLLGVEVYITAGSDERCRRCLELGATDAINYREVDFAEQWADIPMDVILDSIGGAYFEKNLSLLRDDGSLVQINSTGGRKVELNLLQLMQRRIRITGSTLRARDAAFKKALRDEVEREVWPLVLGAEPPAAAPTSPTSPRSSPGSSFGDQQLLRPVIHAVFSADDPHAAAEAHRLLESGEVFGKILLSWF